MSNDIYGYVEPREGASTAKLTQRLRIEAKTLGIGVASLAVMDVYGLPDHLAPGDDAACFRVTDRPGSANASYLADMVDYTPDATLGLPLLGRDRLALLIAWIGTVMNSIEASHMVIALSDSNEVETVEELNTLDLASRILADFEEYAPPNKAYVVRN